MKLFLTKRQWSILFKSLNNPIGILKYLYLIIAYRLKIKNLLFNPVDIDLEPINRCNFKCSHCQVTYWDKPKAKINKFQFREIVAQFPHILKIKLQGMGEPLLNKELVNLLQIGEKLEVIMSFTTNASLLQTQNQQKLAKLNQTYINFSVDGASSEVFESMRNGSDFTQICQNIQEFTSILGIKKDTTRFQVWMLVTQQNLSEVTSVVKLVKELGLNHLNLQTFFSDWGKKSLKTNAENYRLKLASNKLQKELEKAHKKSKEIGVNLNIHYGDYYTKKKICPLPWLSTYIAANGDVVPCSVLADSDTINMGNLFEQDFNLIWNSEKYQEFREKHRRLEIPDCCRQCYLDLD